MLWREPRFAWVLLIYLWFIGFASSIGRFLIAFYQPELGNAFHMSRTWIGLSWSVNLFVGAAASILGGWLMDRYGVRIVMMISSALIGMGTLIILLGSGALSFFVGYGVIFGLAGISGTTVNYVLTLQWFQHHRAKAILVLQSSSSIGIALLTPIFVHYQTFLNWRFGYATMLVIGVTTIFTTYWIVKEKKAPSASHSMSDQSSAKRLPLRERLSQMKTYASNPVIIAVWFALFTCGFHMGTVEMNLMAIHQTTHVHEGMIASSISILGILEIVGALLFAFILDRFNRIRALSWLYAIRIGAFLFLMLQWEASPLLFSIFFGITYLSAVPGAMLVAGEALASSNRSVALNASVFILFHQIGGILSGTVSGAIYDTFHTYQPLIAVNLGLAVLTAAGYIVLERNQLRLQKDQKHLPQRM